MLLDIVGLTEHFWWEWESVKGIKGRLQVLLPENRVEDVLKETFQYWRRTQVFRRPWIKWESGSFEQVARRGCNIHTASRGLRKHANCNVDARFEIITTDVTANFHQKMQEIAPFLWQSITLANGLKQIQHPTRKQSEEPKYYSTTK